MDSIFVLSPATLAEGDHNSLTFNDSEVNVVAGDQIVFNYFYTGSGPSLNEQGRRHQYSYY